MIKVVEEFNMELVMDVTRVIVHFIPAHFSPPDLAHFSPLNCIVSSTQRAHFSPPNSTHFIPNGNFSIAKKHSKNEK